MDAAVTTGAVDAVSRASLACAIALAAVATAATTADAQSKRYPATELDPDDVAEHESGFWAGVADPGRAAYEQQVRDALLDASSDRRRAITRMREAATSRPELFDAWVYLGLLTDQIRDFAGCAEGYGHAAAIDPAWELPRTQPMPGRLTPGVSPRRVLLPGIGAGIALYGGRSLTIAHAICRGRSGDVAGAIAVLEAAVARGETMNELWLRLGEAYLAAGRLDDAAAALSEARAGGRREPDGTWLLAVAHDRARRTALAEAAARDAQGVDPGAASTTSNNRPPSITPGEREYILGLAALTPSTKEPPAPGKPEQALHYFRRFLELAPPASPWRARAGEHARALASVDLAARLEVTGGGFGDRAALERVVRARLPAMRACMQAVPSALVKLRITALGPIAGPARAAPTPAATPVLRPPPLPRTAGIRPRPVAVRPRPVDDSRPPDSEPPGVSAAGELFDPGQRDAVDEAVECVEKLGAGLVLPRPPAGSWATVRIPIAAP